MKSVAFIIPGFTHSSKNKEYLKIANSFERKNIVPIFVSIPWSHATLSGNISYFKKIYQETRAEKKYIFGFSFGAMIAFIASSQEKPTAQILCSLSPYFQEDLPKIEKSWRKIIGLHRYEDFKQYNAKKIAQQTSVKTFLLYGTEEVKQLIGRNKNTFEVLRTSKKLIPVAGAKHDIGNAKYLAAIQSVISSLK